MRYLAVILMILIFMSGCVSNQFHSWDSTTTSTQYINIPISINKDSAESSTPSYNIEDLKKSIVYIRHDVTGCCGSYGQRSSLLGGSGSGVIYYLYKNETIPHSTAYVLTSRHVVDCVFSGTCLYPESDKVTIRLYNGKEYVPNEILYAPRNLDIAILKFYTADTEIKDATLNSDDYSIGDKVVAIGYPAFGVETIEPILEFSITEGSITNIYNLLTYQGLSFTGIQSDALTGHGASGGGLFNQDGELMGTITWGDRENKVTIAIDSRLLFDANITEKFISYPIDNYPLLEGSCCPYGTIAGVDNKCYQPCGKPSTYCSTDSYCLNGQCVSCPSGTVLGSDSKCHQPCGNGYCNEGSYCVDGQCVSCPAGTVFGSDNKCHQSCGQGYCSEGSYCYNNQCISCPSGYVLHTDGNCYPS